MCVRHQLNANKCLLALELLCLCRQVEQLIGALFDVAIGHDQETARASGGVLPEFAPLRAEAVVPALNEWSWWEIMPGSQLLLAAGILQHPFVYTATATL